MKPKSTFSPWDVLKSHWRLTVVKLAECDMWFGLVSGDPQNSPSLLHRVLVLVRPSLAKSSSLFNDWYEMTDIHSVPFSSAWLLPTNNIYEWMNSCCCSLDDCGKGRLAWMLLTWWCSWSEHYILRCISAILQVVDGQRLNLHNFERTFFSFWAFSAGLSSGCETHWEGGKFEVFLHLLWLSLWTNIHFIDH